MRTVKFKYDVGDKVSYASMYGVDNTYIRSCVYTGSGYLFYMTENGQTKAENELSAGHDTAKYRPPPKPKPKKVITKKAVKKITKKPAKKAGRVVVKKSTKKVIVKKTGKKKASKKVIRRKR